MQGAGHQPSRGPIIPPCGGAREKRRLAYIFCERIDQMFERVLIQECPFCLKSAAGTARSARETRRSAAGPARRRDSSRTRTRTRRRTRRKGRRSARFSPFPFAIPCSTRRSPHAAGSSRRELRCVSAAQRHLTLRFSTHFPRAHGGDARSCGRGGGCRGALDLELEGDGWFPPSGPAKVVWAGCGPGREALVALAEALSAALESGDRRRHPAVLAASHAGARAERRGSSAIAAAVRRSAVAAGLPAAFGVDRLLLVRSTLGSGPPRHDVLGAFPLGRWRGLEGCVKARMAIDHAPSTSALASS